MDEKINDWLQQFDIVTEIVQEIHSEQLPEEHKSLAMQRSGFSELPLDYVGDKGWKRRYDYMLFLKSESEVDIQRLANMDWLDDLSDCLYTANKTNSFPQLTGGRKIEEVGCANALTYEESEDGAVSNYSLQIYFNVRGGY